MNDEPIVLLGRGGSGTRLLSQLALAQGVFLGNDLNASLDSDEWVDCIYALAVESLDPGIEQDDVRDFECRHLLRQRATAIARRAALEPGAAWGWKLPETMLVLAQVLRTFPKSKLVHLVRHPITSSLRRTHLTSRNDNFIGRAVLAAAYRDCGRDARAIDDDPDFLRNAITWTFQVARVLDIADARAARDRTLLLRYEDVCANPAAAAVAFATFLGRTQAPVAAAFAARIDDARLGDAVLDERADLVWSVCRATAERAGYKFALASDASKMRSASSR